MGNIKKISVIIPNYNYARYIEGRIKSVVEQTYPIHELIILDDASTDDSVNVIGKYIQQYPNLNIRFEKNLENSGSVFKQWMKGISLTTGDYIWIAEADDRCSTELLATIMDGFEKDPEVVLGYCQSKKIDEQGAVLTEDFLVNTSDIDSEKWRHTYTRSGLDEINDALLFKNTIPNASGVVFKKMDFSPIEEKMLQTNLIGDWWFYIWVVQHGKIHFNAASHNHFRFHDNSVRNRSNLTKTIQDVFAIQEYIMDNFEISEESQKKLASLQKSFNATLEISSKFSEGINFQGIEKEGATFQRLLEEINSYKRVTIYGTGELTRQLIDYCTGNSDYSGSICCVTEDMNEGLVGGKFHGESVATLESAISEYKVDAIIIASYIYQEVIYDRIKHVEEDGIKIIKMT